MTRLHFRVLVVGAGPAGLAAAAAAAEAGADVGLADANPGPGGQVWRAAHSGPGVHWARRVRDLGVRLLTGTRVVAVLGPTAVLGETDAGPLELRSERLILTPGARERFLPFPGWTLPGVTGAGGLQALAKGGLSVAGDRVVVAGTGPLLLAAAAYLRNCGARVGCVVEQAGTPRLAGFLPALLRDGARLRQAATLAWDLRGVPWRTACHVVAAHGRERIEAVTLRRGGAEWTARCDRLACGFGLVPNLELPLSVGCAVADGVVRVDAWQRTSISGVYCAGEATGVAGLEAALAEGSIAGLAATGRSDLARTYFPARERGRRFGAALERAFALRAELRELPDASTTVCRCEDVPYAELRAHGNWREAKLQTRCGMGPCQGRVCGTALAFLFGWTPDSVRPPVTAASVGALAVVADGDGGAPAPG